MIVTSNYRYADTTFQITACKKILSFIRQYFFPFVELFIDPLEINENSIYVDYCEIKKNVKGVKIKLHGERYGFVEKTESRTIVHDPKFNLRYEISGKDFYILINKSDRSNPDILLECLRVIRRMMVDVFSKLPKVHGAVVAFHEHGICLLGAKGAGKSTTCLSLVSELPDVKFVTNDKFLFDDVSKKAYGIPSAISLYPDSVDRFIKNKKNKELFTMRGKKYFWPNAIFDINKIAPFAILKLSLSLSISESFYLTEVQPEIKDKFFSTHVIRFSDEMGGKWLCELLEHKKKPEVKFTIPLIEAGVKPIKMGLSEDLAAFICLWSVLVKPPS